MEVVILRAGAEGYCVWNLSPIFLRPPGGVFGAGDWDQQELNSEVHINFPKNLQSP